MNGTTGISIQPDYEVFIRYQGQECAVAGLFFGEGDSVDVGVGLADNVEQSVVGYILALAGQAFEDATTWYQKSSMEAFPDTAEKIKHGDWS